MVRGSAVVPQMTHRSPAGQLTFQLLDAGIEGSNSLHLRPADRAAIQQVNLRVLSFFLGRGHPVQHPPFHLLCQC